MRLFRRSPDQKNTEQPGQSRKKGRIPAIPQRYQWLGALAFTTVAISAGLGYQAVTGDHGFWGAAWRAMLSAVILSVGCYLVYRRWR